MRVIACLLLALIASSTVIGICNGKVWIQGYDPEQPQTIQLDMQREKPLESSYTSLPVCQLFLSEPEVHTVNLSLNVSTAALLYQDDKFATWLSIDDQEPEMLHGILNTTGSAAGEFYKRQYDVNLTGLANGNYSVKVRVTGDYYGYEGGNYDCVGNVSVIVQQTPATEPFSAATTIAAAAILIGVIVAAVVFLITRRRHITLP